MTGSDTINRSVESLSNEEWAAQYPKVESWLNRRQPSRGVFVAILRPWYDWLMAQAGPWQGLSPDELLDFQKRMAGDERFLLMDKVQDYIAEHGDWRRSYKRKVFTTIMSFFNLNRADMPKDPEIARNFHSEQAPMRKDLTVAHLKQIVLGKNIMYRAIFLSILEGAMGQDELIEWSSQGIGPLMDELKGEKRRRHGVIRVDLKPRKKNPQPYFTLIGGDALRAIEDWVRHRETLRAAFERKHPKGHFPDSIFVSIHGKPLTLLGIQTYWRRLAYDLGFIKSRSQGGPGTRYGVNPHQIRKLFRTLYGRSRSENAELHRNVGEFLMGHTVDPYDYNRFFDDEDIVIQEYVKALPYLDIVSSDKAEGKVDEDEVENLRRYTKELEEKLKKQDAEFEKKFGEERKISLNLETALKTQKDDVESLKSGHADLKASAYVRTKLEKELEDRVKELEDQLQNRNGQIQNLKNDFETNLKSELQKEKEAREEFQKQMIQIMRQTGSEWRLSIGPEAILKEIAATERAIEFFESRQDPKDDENADVMKKHLAGLKRDLEQGRGEEFWVTSHPSPSPLSKVLNENKNDEEEKTKI